MVDEAGVKRAWKIWELGQSEAEYRAMLINIRQLEREYERILQDLHAEQESVLRDYVSLCEEMSWRMLQIACATMRLPGGE